MDTHQPAASNDDPLRCRLVPINIPGDESEETQSVEEKNQKAFHIAYPKPLSAAEDTALKERHERLDGPDKNSDSKNLRKQSIGLALSGGGIRSATFSLGMLQAMAQAKLLKSIDFLSTVSGGGYIGSFFGRLFERQLSPQEPPEQPTLYDTFLVRPFRSLLGQRATKTKGATLPPSGSTPGAPSTQPEDGPMAGVEKILNPINHSSKEVDWLRENGRYLSPNGSGDVLLATGIVLRNWVALQVVILTFVLTVFLVTTGVRAGIARWGWNLIQSLSGTIPDLVRGGVWWSPYIFLPLASFLLFLVPLGWAYWLVGGGLQRKDRSESFWRWISIVVVGLLIPFALLFFPDTAQIPGKEKIVLKAVVGCSVLTILFRLTIGILARQRCTGSELAGAPQIVRNKLSSLLGFWLAITSVLLVFALIDSLGQSLYAYLKVTGIHKGLLSILAAFIAVASSLAAYGEKISQWLGGAGAKPRVKLPVSILAMVAAVFLASGLFIGVNATAQGIAWGWNIPPGNPGQKIVEYFGTKPEMKSYSITGKIEGATSPGSLEPNLVVQETSAALSQGATTTVCESSSMHLRWLLFAFAVSGFLTFAFGRTLIFINRSSQAAMYGARLTRAYLGASNPKRLEGGRSAVTEVIPGDDKAFDEYRPHEHGGPVHLINVTLNETVEGKSQTEQRDRKGMGMAIGPCGISVGVKHHALWDGPKKEESQMDHPFQIFQTENSLPIDAEPMTLGQWTEISGAAFSTGLGSRTSLGLSLLCGLANIRLGYWWDSGIKPALRRKSGAAPKMGFTRWCGEIMATILPVQMYLLDEFTGRFHGPARRHWYLSDGGHFENTGAYELIRRRLPLILVCDNGCDPEYQFDDLANLVRKARTDFNAEISFLNEKDLEKLKEEFYLPGIGTLEQIRRGPWSEGPINARMSLAHTALARISYDGDPAGSLLLLIKPSLTGEEPVDLLHYHENHDDFPHETTLDQYFDDAQWESYRKLGEWIGTMVFQEPKSGSECKKAFEPGTAEFKALLHAVKALRAAPQPCEEKKEKKERPHSA